MNENMDKMKLNPDELDAVSGGQKVYDYYHKQRKCSCGCEDFTCLGWDDAKHGYNYKCNACGETMFIFK